MDTTPLLDRLRDDIARGAFYSKERLIEAELVTRYKAARAEVRMALMALEKEGLLDREPNRGARVRHITIDEALEILEVRRPLEGLCAARAAQSATTLERKQLRTLLDDLRRFRRSGDIKGYARVGDELHDRIYDAAKHKTARELLARLNLLTIRQLFTVALVPERVELSLREHEAIVEAIVRGDADAARAAAEEHVRSMEAALRALSQLTPASGH